MSAWLRVDGGTYRSHEISGQIASWIHSALAMCTPTSQPLEYLAPPSLVISAHHSGDISLSKPHTFRGLAFRLLLISHPSPDVLLASCHITSMLVSLLGCILFLSAFDFLPAPRLRGDFPVLGRAMIAKMVQMVCGWSRVCGVFLR